jgi:hypothetical protein
MAGCGRRGKVVAVLIPERRMSTLGDSAEMI